MADNATSDSTAQPDRVVASGTLIDFPNPDAWSGRRVLLGVASGALVVVFISVLVGVMASFAGSGSSTAPNAAIGVCIVFWIAAMVFGWALRARSRRRTRDIVAGHRDGSLQNIFSALFVRSFYRGGPILTQVARALVAQGRAGAVVRIARPNRAAPIDPLSVPFEPVPLDESVPLFLGLEQHARAAGGEGCTSQADDASADEGASRGVFRRRILLSGGWLMIAIFAFNAVMAGFQAYLLHRITLNVAMWTVCLLVAFVGLGGRGAWRSRQQWLLVPGGLASRRARFRRRDWELHLFQRESSVLIVRSGSRHIWAAYVADDQTCVTARMTRREAVMLLRAWLSPLPTPPLERLSDLA